MSATPHRYKLFICCSIPEPKASLTFELRFRAYVHLTDFKNGYIIKCVIEIKQGCGGHNPQKVWMASTKMTCIHLYHFGSYRPVSL